jgi:hypothetical protein
MMKGANPRIRDNDGKTPLDLLKTYPNGGIFKKEITKLIGS